MDSKRASRKQRQERIFKNLLARYRRQPGALIPLLQQTQDLFGYLPEKALTRIARSLRLSPSQVYGVATFYSQFRLSPIGKNIIKVCHGTACHVAGAEKISESLEHLIKIKTGETTSDGNFTVENVACLGCCSLSPVIMINKTAHGKIAPTKLSGILKKYR